MYSLHYGIYGPFAIIIFNINHCLFFRLSRKLKMITQRKKSRVCMLHKLRLFLAVLTLLNIPKFLILAIVILALILVTSFRLGIWKVVE